MKKQILTALEKSLSKIMNPVFDAETKTIYSTYNIGPFEYHYETYKWKKAKRCWWRKG